MQLAQQWTLQFGTSFLFFIDRETDALHSIAHKAWRHWRGEFLGINHIGKCMVANATYRYGVKRTFNKVSRLTMTSFCSERESSLIRLLLLLDMQPPAVVALVLKLLDLPAVLRSFLAFCAVRRASDRNKGQSGE